MYEMDSGYQIIKEIYIEWEKSVSQQQEEQCLRKAWALRKKAEKAENVHSD